MFAVVFLFLFFLACLGEKEIREPQQTQVKGGKWLLQLSMRAAAEAAQIALRAACSGIENIR